jgi:transmembrane sensor
MGNREQAEREASYWIARRESGPWDPADAAAFANWLNASRSHEAAYYRFRAMWKETGRLNALSRTASPEGTLSEAFEHREARFAPEPVQRQMEGTSPWRVHRNLAIAASLLIAAVLGGFLWSVLLAPTYSTAVGGLESVPMADGSRIIMNTDSELRIAFSETERRVELARGEAFFDAAKDPRRPFVVTAGSKRIVAVGTQFSVRRHEEEIQVSVTEGAVRIESARNAKSGAGVLLRAGTMGRSQNGAVLVQKRPLDEIEQQLTWRSGTLTFENTPLAQAVAEFNRYNARKIVIEDPSIAAIEVGGVFRATNIEPFIRLIEDGLSIGVREEKERIVLARD